MKKHYLAIIASIAILSTANAQFYGNVSTGRGGQISVFGGISSTTAAPQFRFNTQNADIYWQWEEIEADKGTAFVEPTFLITFSNLRSNSEKFRLGAMFGFGYTKSQWQADFAATTLGIATSRTMWAMSNTFDIQLGLEGSYNVSEPISVDFAIGPAVMFISGCQARTEKYLATTLVPDADANEWHKAEKMGMGSPNVEIGAIGRLGASYHFSETMWTGLSFQYRMPFFSTMTALQDMYSNDGYYKADDNLIYGDIKHKGWSLMLTFGINFE